MASYCDFGYVFDHTKNKCIVDACKPEDVGKSFYIIIIVICVILVAAVIAFVICCIIQNKKKQERLRQYKINNNEGLINDNTSEEKNDV